MTLVIIYDRDNTKHLEVEVGETETVQDLKRRMEGLDPETLLFSNKGEILSDTTLLSSLGEKIELTMLRDIELTSIELNQKRYSAPAPTEHLAMNIAMTEETQSEDPSARPQTEGSDGAAGKKVKILINGHELLVDAKNIVMNNGLAYYVTRKDREQAIQNRRIQILQEQIQQLATPQFFAQFFLLLFILSTNNLFLLFVVLTIRSLRIISRAFLENEIWKLVKGPFPRAVFMFFSSFFLIDHGLFYKERH